MVKIQCGYEDTCKTKNCLKCRHKLSLTSLKLTLAEATAIEDFAMVDIDSWSAHRHGRSQRNLEQDVLRKMLKRIVWERKGRWIRKIKWVLFNV